MKKSKIRTGTEGTKQKIFTAAMASFEKQGYEKTTMRSIAKEAGVSTGNSYYYYPSKQSIILEFYRRLAQDLDSEVSHVFKHSDDLQERLRYFMSRRLEKLMPYKKSLESTAGNLFDPNSSVWIFDPDGLETRSFTISKLAEIIDSSNIDLPKWLKVYAPTLVWLWHLLIIYYWSIDKSKDKQATHKMIDHSLVLMIQSMQLMNLTMVKTNAQPMFESLYQLVWSKASSES